MRRLRRFFLTFAMIVAVTGLAAWFLVIHELFGLLREAPYGRNHLVYVALAIPGSIAALGGSFLGVELGERRPGMKWVFPWIVFPIAIPTFLIGIGLLCGLGAAVSRTNGSLLEIIAASWLVFAFGSSMLYVVGGLLRRREYTRASSFSSSR